MMMMICHLCFFGTADTLFRCKVVYSSLLTLTHERRTCDCDVERTSRKVARFIDHLVFNHLSAFAESSIDVFRRTVYRYRLIDTSTIPE